MPDAPVRPARQPPDPARHGYRPCASSSSRPPPPSSPDPSATTTPPPPASPPKPAKPGTNTHPATTHSDPSGKTTGEYALIGYATSPVLRDISETVELVVSELATNAIKASVDADGRLPGYDAKERSRWIGLRLSSDQARVLVEVWDSNPLAPDPRTAHADDEAGRGLTLVASVCERWDWYPVSDGLG